ncbi:hypothetical protein BJX62DRAFT_230629 [Aspergillus germanicus]
MAQRQQEVIDEADIRFLIGRERYFRDTRRWKELRAAYHPDASRTYVHISWYKGDIDGFVAGSERLDTSSVSIIHKISPAITAFNGDKALCESVGDITARFTASNGYEYDLISTARFISRLEKLESKWYMLSLEVIYIRDIIYPVGVSPTPDYSSIRDWPRKSYQFVAWHLKDRGVEPASDLPGEDDPASEREVLDRNHEWLL